MNSQTDVTTRDDFSVLDMGCGIGGSAFFLAKEIKNVGSVLGVDISENMLHVISVCNNEMGGHLCCDFSRLLERAVMNWNLSSETKYHSGREGRKVSLTPIVSSFQR